MPREGAPVAGVLAPSERAQVQAEFGVGPAQVVRDHLISHVLGVLGAEMPEQLVFFGGTALARTHLPALRLSEDIDLIAVGPRSEVGLQMERVLGDAMRRTFGEVQFLPSFAETRGSEPVVLVAGESSIQVQLLDPIGYPKWPTRQSDLIQRYSDAPSARLTVPTRSAFVAAKVAAWADRATPRDLYDLWALQELGAFDAEAARLFERIGPGGRPSERTFRRPPDPAEWERALAHQCRIRVSPEAALQSVRAAWVSLA